MRKLVLTTLLFSGMAMAQECKEIKVLPVECKGCEVKTIARVPERGVVIRSDDEYRTQLLRAFLGIAGFKVVQEGGSELKVLITKNIIVKDKSKITINTAEFILNSKGKEEKFTVSTQFADDDGETALVKGVRALVERCKP